MTHKPTILSVERIRTRVVDLFTAHDKGQLDTVDDLMKKWKGKENELLKQLCDNPKIFFCMINEVAFLKNCKCGFHLIHFIVTEISPIGIKEQYTIGNKLGTLSRKGKERKPKRFILPPVYALPFKIIAIGGFATVRKCRDKTTNVMYALKIIDKKNLDKEDLVILDREVHLMRQ
ncbi:hypothetical protein RFI_24305, partial [Reticulomyxa filosa]